MLLLVLYFQGHIHDVCTHFLPVYSWCLYLFLSELYSWCWHPQSSPVLCHWYSQHFTLPELVVDVYTMSACLSCITSVRTVSPCLVSPSCSAFPLWWMTFDIYKDMGLGDGSGNSHALLMLSSEWVVVTEWCSLNIDQCGLCFWKQHRSAMDTFCPAW